MNKKIFKLKTTLIVNLSRQIQRNQKITNLLPHNFKLLFVLPLYILWVCFGLLIQWHINSQGLFDAKAILICIYQPLHSGRMSHKVYFQVI